MIQLTIHEEQDRSLDHMVQARIHLEEQGERVELSFIQNTGIQRQVLAMVFIAGALFGGAIVLAAFL